MSSPVIDFYEEILMDNWAESQIITMKNLFLDIVTHVGKDKIFLHANISFRDIPGSVADIANFSFNNLAAV